jgi:rare lipoprotein A
MANTCGADSTHPSTCPHYGLVWTSRRKRNPLSLAPFCEVERSKVSLLRFLYGLLNSCSCGFCFGWIRRRLLCGLLAGTILALTHGATDARAAQRGTGWMSETGTASYYGRRLQGLRTASGVRFNDHAFTAAHRWLPFGTRVRVTSLATGRSVVVIINDRLPARRRVIDLSLGAARRLGIVGRGLARVSLEPARL